MLDINELKEFTTQLASQAGELLLQKHKQQSETNITRRTSPKGMKLAEDATMDKWLVQKIQAKYPDHRILAEESGQHENQASEILWIIDPIDGSVNFSTYNPFVAISLAVQVNNELVLGVIEAPMLGEQYLAIKNQGAWLNNKAIKVSAISDLNQAYVISCDGGMEDRQKVFETIVKPFYYQTKDFRKLGSAALECAWVATGRADAYITMAIDSWDVAAGVLLVQEAGGQVSDFNNQPWKNDKLDLIFSNSNLHSTIINNLE